MAQVNMLEGLKDVVRGLVGPAPHEAGVSSSLGGLSLEYSYDDLFMATGGFKSKLGAGGAGAVYRGSLRGGTEVAVKVLPGGSDNSTGFDEELTVLSRFRHPNLVTLLGWAQRGDDRYLVYELLPGGDVAKKLWNCKNRKVSFGWRQRLRAARDAACGLSYMLNSKPKAFHRDIKTANILLDTHGVAKVADFGLAGTLRRGSHFSVEQIACTPGYACPSYMQSGRVSEQTEAYSFGVVLLELLTGAAPASTTPAADGGTSSTPAITYPLFELLSLGQPNPHDRVIGGLDVTADWPRHVSSELADLALSCVSTRPEKRPSFEKMVQVLRHLCKSSGAETESHTALSAPQPLRLQAPVLPQAPVLRPVVPPRVANEGSRKSSPAVSRPSEILEAQAAGAETVPAALANLRQRWNIDLNNTTRSSPTGRSSPTYYGAEAAAETSDSVSNADEVEDSGHLEWLDPPTDLLRTILGAGKIFDVGHCCSTIDRVGPERTCVIGRGPPRPRPPGLPGPCMVIA
jgi:serine/threonine protein kinase